MIMMNGNVQQPQQQQQQQQQQQVQHIQQQVAQQVNNYDPGYSVYLLYQKEVYNSDHAFLQSMMDWIYTANDSPYKYIFRNKAFININHYGITIKRDLNSNQSSNDNSNNDSSISSNGSNTWNSINFNLKHLKEIYVDRRHKDTCVLVSKVSSSSGSNYVWKKTNPSNYQTFRSPYALNNAYKKSYLLTILKFKDGPSKLLQSIQMLDNILADFNKLDPPINSNSQQPNQNNTNSVNINTLMQMQNQQQQQQSQQMFKAIDMKGHDSQDELAKFNSSNNSLNSNLTNSNLGTLNGSTIGVGGNNKVVANGASNLKHHGSTVATRQPRNLRSRPSLQQYFADTLSKSSSNNIDKSMEQKNQMQQSQQLVHLPNKHHHRFSNNLHSSIKPSSVISGSISSSINNLNNQSMSFLGHNSFMNMNRQVNGSIDNGKNPLLYQINNSNSNNSLQSYLMNAGNTGTINGSGSQMQKMNQQLMYNNSPGPGSLLSNSVSISRQSSINDIRHPPQLQNHARMGTVNGNSFGLTQLQQQQQHQQQQHSSSISGSLIAVNRSNSNIGQYLSMTPTSGISSNTSGTLNSNANFMHIPVGVTTPTPYMQSQLGRHAVRRSSSRSSQLSNASQTNTNNSNKNLSSENLSEIGFQQYKKKVIRSTRNLRMSSTSSLKNSELGIAVGGPFVSNLQHVHGNRPYKSFYVANPNQSHHTPNGVNMVNLRCVDPKLSFSNHSSRRTSPNPAGSIQRSSVASSSLALTHRSHSTNRPSLNNGELISNMNSHKFSSVSTNINNFGSSTASKLLNLNQLRQPQLQPKQHQLVQRNTFKNSLNYMSNFKMKRASSNSSKPQRMIESEQSNEEDEEDDSNEGDEMEEGTDGYDEEGDNESDNENDTFEFDKTQTPRQSQSHFISPGMNSTQPKMNPALNQLNGTTLNLTNGNYHHRNMKQARDLSSNLDNNSNEEMVSSDKFNEENNARIKNKKFKNQNDMYGNNDDDDEKTYMDSDVNESMNTNLNKQRHSIQPQQIQSFRYSSKQDSEAFIANIKGINTQFQQQIEQQQINKEMIKNKIKELSKNYFKPVKAPSESAPGNTLTTNNISAALMPLAHKASFLSNASMIKKPISSSMSPNATASTSAMSGTSLPSSHVNSSVNRSNANSSSIKLPSSHNYPSKSSSLLSVDEKASKYNEQFSSNSLDNNMDIIKADMEALKISNADIKEAQANNMAKINANKIQVLAKNSSDAQNSNKISNSSENQQFTVNNAYNNSSSYLPEKSVKTHASSIKNEIKASYLNNNQHAFMNDGNHGKSPDLSAIKVTSPRVKNVENEREQRKAVKEIINTFNRYETKPNFSSNGQHASANQSNSLSAASSVASVRRYQNDQMPGSPSSQASKNMSSSVDSNQVNQFTVNNSASKEGPVYRPNRPEPPSANTGPSNSNSASLVKPSPVRPYPPSSSNSLGSPKLSVVQNSHMNARTNNGGSDFIIDISNGNAPSNSTTSNGKDSRLSHSSNQPMSPSVSSNNMPTRNGDVGFNKSSNQILLNKLNAISMNSINGNKLVHRDSESMSRPKQPSSAQHANSTPSPSGNSHVDKSKKTKFINHSSSFNITNQHGNQDSSPASTPSIAKPSPMSSPSLTQVSSIFGVNNNSNPHLDQHQQALLQPNSRASLDVGLLSLPQRSPNGVAKPSPNHNLGQSSHHRNHLGGSTSQLLSPKTSAANTRNMNSNGSPGSSTSSGTNTTLSATQSAIFNTNPAGFSSHNNNLLIESKKIANSISANMNKIGLSSTAFNGKSSKTLGLSSGSMLSMNNERLAKFLEEYKSNHLQHLHHQLTNSISGQKISRQDSVNVNPANNNKPNIQSSNVSSNRTSGASKSLDSNRINIYSPSKSSSLSDTSNRLNSTSSTQNLSRASHSSMSSTNLNNLGHTQHKNTLATMSVTNLSELKNEAKKSNITTSTSNNNLNNYSNNKTEENNQSSNQPTSNYNILNVSFAEQSEYDLSTYGLDQSVVEGDLQPIVPTNSNTSNSNNNSSSTSNNNNGSNGNSNALQTSTNSLNNGTGNENNGNNSNSNNANNGNERQANLVLMPQTTPRKRTFANMIWPMDPEEEKILRSNSPYVVPEVIVQRNERVKSILKKSSFFTSSSNSSTASPSASTPTQTGPGSINGGVCNGSYAGSAVTNSTTSSIVNGTATFSKKRVDFHENFCFVNFFDTHTDEETK